MAGPDLIQAMPPDRLFYGYRLRSQFVLPGLPAAAGAGEPDIHLVRGAVPASLADPSWTSPFVEVGADGCVLVRLGDRLRFLVDDGAMVTIDHAPEVDTPEIETFLCSVVAGIVLHRRGALALHAACVAIGGTAVAIAAPSGGGKSTLAAALSAAGHGLLTDDICRVTFPPAGALAMPGPPRLRLWPDAARALGYQPADLAAARPGHPKRVLAVAAAAGPTPLGAVIRLGLSPRIETPRLERLRGPEAIMPAADLVYRVRLGRRLGRRVGLFRDLALLAAQVPVFRLVRPAAPGHLPALVALVRSAVGAP